MSSEAVVAVKPPYITAHVQKFRETKSFRSLLQAVLLVLRQQRTTELLYGVYCGLFHRASTIAPAQDEAALISLIKEHTAQADRGILSRAQLIERYGATFKVRLLPEDFESTRCESIWQEGNEFLVVGEYGEGARLVCITPTACFINEHYQHVRGVRHIHSVERYGNAGEFLVATGDSKKFLDVWSTRYGHVGFVRRVRRGLAGFTAAIRVNGEYYFGTDFSSRPNYVTTLQGVKYFFPPKAYKLYVTAFYAFFDRYLVAVNSELRVVGNRRALSIFDTVQQKFIYCDYWDGEGHGNTRRAA